MARPDPKVKAPAPRKKRPRLASDAPVPVNTNPLTEPSVVGVNLAAVRNDGRPPPHQKAPKIPARSTSQMISAPLIAVAMQRIAAIAHATGTRSLVFRASLTAAIAIIAKTAGPTPEKTLWTAESP